MRFGDDLAKIRNTGTNGRKRGKMRARHARDYLGKRRLAGSGRSPQHHGRYVVALDSAPQRMTGAHDVLLPDELIERLRAHARS